MCGLLSVITKSRNGFQNEQRDAFELMLFIDTIRGDDSTGVFVVDNIGNVKLAKEATYAPYFMKSKEYDELRKKMWSNGWAAVGHNRAATRGEVTDENAHPFVVDDNIVLVHNGSYYGDHKKLKDVPVDSLAIAHTISETDTVENALRKVNSAYALIWYNQDERSLNFIRNTARPLWTVETDNAWLFSSEDHFLNLVIAKFKLRAKSAPVELKEYDHHKFVLSEFGATSYTTQQLDCSFHKHNPQEIQVTRYGGDSMYDTTEWDEWAAERNIRRHQLACAHGACDDDDDGSVETFLKSTNTVVTPIRTPLLLEGKGGSAGKEEAGKAAINQITKQVVNGQLVNDDDVETRDTSSMNKVMGAIYNKCRTMTFLDYGRIRDEIPDGTRIKVLINDIVDADDDPKSGNYLLIGQTLVNQKVYATFKVTDDNFSKLLASSTNDAMFEILVSGVSWKCTEGLEVKQKQQKKMGDWQGVVIVHGKNPVPIYMQGQGNA